MTLPSRDILRRLGAGESIAAICAAANLSREQFDAWWQAEAAARVPETTGHRRAAVKGPVRIERNRWGIPSIYADNDEDLFFGFGHAMAEDRLFQLDYLRRRGSGRLAEVLGRDGTDLDLLAHVVGFKSIFELDLFARTVGLRRIAEHNWTTLPEETRHLLTAFSAGINAVIEETRDRPPIEFDLLDYRPEPWSPIDSLTIEIEFPWYLTGRFPVIVIPELARRNSATARSIEPFSKARPTTRASCRPARIPMIGGRLQPVGRSVSDPQGAEGSNNWVLGGSVSARRAAARRQRSARAVRRGVVLVRGPSVRRIVPCRGHGLRRHARRHVRPQRARRLGLHQQHLLAARSLSGKDRSESSGLLPLRRPLGAGTQP